MDQIFKWLPTIIGLLENPQITKIIEALMKVGSTTFPDVPTDQLPAAVSTMYDSDRVKWVQTALKLLGNDVQVTGTLDDATKAVVKTFQGQEGLTVDGWPGPITSEKLRAKLLVKP